jgi:hypothetical protein
MHALLNSYQVREARDISTAEKLRIFISNVKSVLPYRCESWRVTKRITRDLKTFINRYLGKMFNIFWTNVTSNALKKPVAGQINLWK